MKFLSTRLLSMLLMLSLVSCGKDDLGVLLKNNISLNGQPFPVISASIAGVSIEGEGHVALSLVSGTSTEAKTLTLDFPYTVGVAIEGNYAFPAQANTRLLDDFLTNYIVFSQTTQVDEQLSEGTMSLQSNGGNNYTVAIDLTMDGGSSFSGSYTGDFVVNFQDN